MGQPVPEPRKTERMSLKEYLFLQDGEAKGPVNTGYTRDSIGHEPSPGECWWHFVLYGGAVWFAAVHSDLHIWVTGEVIGKDPMTLDVPERERNLMAVWDSWQDLLARYPDECRRVLFKDSGSG